MAVMANAKLEYSILICLRKSLVTAGFSNHPEISNFFKMHQ
jgi:hypothetical protein